MIAGDERSRFFVSEGDGIPGGETTWYIVDWDQRRTITVTVDEYRFDDEVAVEYLNKYMHQLPYDVCAVHISPDGDLLKASTSPADDRTQCMEYLRANALHLPPGVDTI
ncbi:hypothetical protein ACJZ2D_009197 [Fusarium nematophilum]